MVTYFNQGGRHKAEGVEILRYRLCLPVFTDKKRISKFYEDISELTLEYCKNELTEYAKKAYTECDIPKKKFNFPPICYSLDGRVTYEDGYTAFVKLIAKTEHRGSPDEYRTAYDAHAWSLSDELLMPPRLAAEGFLGRRDIPRTLRGDTGFLVENGKYYVCFKDRTEEIVPSQKQLSLNDNAQ